nr:MAG TPA: hypothetical protein [Crassvirales sp.]
MLLNLYYSYLSWAFCIIMISCALLIGIEPISTL